MTPALGDGQRGWGAEQVCERRSDRVAVDAGSRAQSLRQRSDEPSEPLALFVVEAELRVVDDASQHGDEFDAYLAHDALQLDAFGHVEAGQFRFAFRHGADRFRPMSAFLSVHGGP